MARDGNHSLQRRALNEFQGCLIAFLSARPRKKQKNNSDRVNPKTACHVINGTAFAQVNVAERSRLWEILPSVPLRNCRTCYNIANQKLMDHSELENQYQETYGESVVFSSPVFLTPEGFARLQQELDHLTTVRRAEITERLRESKDHGEFSEDNQELDETKFEQKLVEDRIKELKIFFANAQILDLDQVDTSKVGVGTLVTVADADRKIEFTVRIVASIEADPDEDLISEESPMGVALMGASEGETVSFRAPAGMMKYLVKQISK